LVAAPSGRSTQDIVVGIDPGKLFSGAAVQSSKFTLFLAHLVLPFKSVTQKMTARRILRRARRGRRINRKLSYNKRSHRQKRFDNRRQKKLPPSIRANKQLELRVVKELLKIFPVSHIRYEIIKARTENGKGKGFSPAMVGQKVMLEWLEQLRPTSTQEGWQTSILRQQLGLVKDKTDKSAQKAETHAHDGIALAASHFMSFEKFHTANTRGHRWLGQVTVTPAPFRVMARPNLYRRQLHFENPVSDQFGDKKMGQALNKTDSMWCKTDLPMKPRNSVKESASLHHTTQPSYVHDDQTKRLADSKETSRAPFSKPCLGDAPANRKRKGGTVTPFGFRSGDKVRAEKAGVIYVGWIGGYTQTEKTKNVSVYDHNWRRIGQFSPNKVQLLQRSTRLCVVA